MICVVSLKVKQIKVGTSLLSHYLLIQKGEFSPEAVGR